MAVVHGILTEIGGATSHAAVVSRELGVPCIVGCGAGTLASLEGRLVTVDASSGEVFEGRLPALERTRA
jgi:pyruvate,orthophosphate dikinase